MSGFAARWLDLREPADIAARDKELLRAAIAAADRRAGWPIVDLGCGTGATLRAFAKGGGGARSFRLIDHDAALLAEAEERHSGFGAIETRQADLSALDPAWFEGAALVAASAVFDLASLGFVEALADRLTGRGLGLYAALNYDGRMEWSVPHALDGDVVAAFNADQRRDKGLGKALGPTAAEHLAAAFAARGHAVHRAETPWRLGPPDAALQRAHAEGVASAAISTGRLSQGEVEAWLAARLQAIDGGGTALVGHIDLLALPNAS